MSAARRIDRLRRRLERHQRRAQELAIAAKTEAVLAVLVARRLDKLVARRLEKLEAEQRAEAFEQSAAFEGADRQATEEGYNSDG